MPDPIAPVPGAPITSAASHAPASPPPPRESDEPRPCRQCGYNLEGQKPRDNIITCPECGLLGTWRDVLRGRGAAPSWGWLFLAMSGPSTVCFSIAAIMFLISRHWHDWFGIMIYIPVIFGIFMGVFFPPIVAANTTTRVRDSGVKFWIFIGGVAAGWGANIIALLVMWLGAAVLSLLIQ